MNAILVGTSGWLVDARRAGPPRRSGRGALATALAFAVTASVAVTIQPIFADRGERAAERAESASAPSVDTQRVEAGEVPAGFSAGEWADIQRQIAPTASAPTVVLTNPSVALPQIESGATVARFGTGAVEITSTTSDTAVSLRTSSIGDLDATAPAGVATADGVHYQQAPAVTEWYRDTAAGLQQGFTIAEPVTTDPVTTIEVKVAGGTPTLVDPTTVHITTATGESFVYRELLAWDANGDLLDATMAVDGETILLNIVTAGAVYPVTVDPIIEPSSKTVPAPGSDLDFFGASVDIDGNRMAVGAFGDDPGFSDAGAVYLFERAAAGAPWVADGVITDPSPGSPFRFGDAVAVIGDQVAVGESDRFATESRPGEVHVFVRTGPSTWVQRGASISATATYDAFGASVAWQTADRLIVGSPLFNGTGAVYQVIWDGVSAWNPPVRLTPVVAPAAGDELGYSVDVSLERSGTSHVIVAGAPGYDANVGLNVDAGALHIFRDLGAGAAGLQVVENGTGWGADDRMGRSVASDAGYLAVAGIGAQPNAEFQAYLLEPTGPNFFITGTHNSTFGFPSFSRANEFVELVGRNLLLGGGREAVEVFRDADGSGFSSTPVDSFFPSTRLPSDGIGTAVAADRATLIAAAPNDDQQGAEAGAVYTGSVPLSHTFLPSTGDWHVPQNWDTGVVPRVDDTAVVPPGSFVTINQPASVRALVGNSGDLSYGPGGSLDVSPIVTSVEDDPDTNQGDGVCRTTAGECTLRAALQETNAFPGAATIRFGIPGAGVQTITPVTSLPAVTGVVTIDGYTQPGAAANTLAVGSDAVLLIELSGQGDTGAAATNQAGLDIFANDVVVRGLVINGHNRPGSPPGASIRIRAGANDVVIEGNYLGTNAAGTAKTVPTSVSGIEVAGTDAVIGGPAPAQRNVALGLLHGVYVRNDASATIVGNYLGTDATGTLGISGDGSGVQLEARASATVGGTTPGSGNVLSGNDFGVQVAGAAVGFSKVVLGNFIGTDATGNAKTVDNVGVNQSFGVFVNDFATGGTVQIGDGTPQGRNVITASRGIFSELPVDVRGNYVGVGADGTTALSISETGVYLQNGFDSQIGGIDVGDGNVIANAVRGVYVDSVSSVVGQRHAIVGNSMYGHSTAGIVLRNAGANDAGDPDSGANNLQNFPVISPSIVAGDLIVDYTIDSTVANSAYPIAIDVYVADDALGRSGRRYLGRTIAAAPGAQSADLGSADTLSVTLGEVLVATATDANDNTSQFSGPATTFAGGSQYEVNSAADGSDASPGDGLCATSTPGECTLRAAIEEANAGAGDGLITFAIPGGGVRTISAATALPAITDTVTIDGLTQPGATCASGTPVLRIDLDLPGGLGSNGLVLNAPSTVRGVVVRGPETAISVLGNTTIDCNFIGTDATGVAQSGMIIGVQVAGGSANVVTRNLIANTTLNYGMFVSGDESIVQGNRINVTPAGAAIPVCCLSASVYIVGDDNLIGGAAPGDGNVLGLRANDGVNVPLGTGNTIRGNTYPRFAEPCAGSCLGGLGIDLGAGLGGPTPNDVGDADAGPNNLQNHPDVASATALAGDVRVIGTLDSTPSRTFDIDVSAAAECSASGFGDADRYLGTFQVTTNASGLVNFVDTLTPAPALPLGWSVTATATDTVTGDTSEFSACRTVAADAPGPADKSISEEPGFERYGVSVAIDGDTAVVAERGNPGVESAIHILGRNVGTGAWERTQQAEFTSAPFSSGVVDVALSGNVLAAVAVSGDVAIWERAAPGAPFTASAVSPGLAQMRSIATDGAGVFAAGPLGASLWTDTGASWTPVNSGGAPPAGFGTDVAIDGPWIVVAATDANLAIDGTVFIYDRDGATFSGPSRTINVPAASATEGGFGASIAIDGDGSGARLVIAQLLEDNDAGDPRGVQADAGAVWAYDLDRNPGDGSITVGTPVKLVPQDGDSGNAFGTSVAVAGDTIIVGAGAAGELGLPTRDGAAYLFRRTGPSAWVESEAIRAADRAANDRFGDSVDTDGLFAIVGAPFDDNVNGIDAGAAYIVPAVPTTISLDFGVPSGEPTTVNVAPNGIRVTDIDRGALGAANAAGSVAASSIEAIGPEDTALAAITIGATPLRAIVLDSTPLRAIPLVDIEVNQDGGGGWAALLENTELENVPLVNLTFGDALSNTQVSGRIAALPLRAIDVAGTPLRAIPIAAIALGATPLRAIPLRAIAPGEPNPWCDIIAPLLQQSGQTCEQALDDLNLMEITLRGVPLRAIPLRAIPLRAIDVNSTPLRAIPLRAIDLEASPLRAIPLRAIDLLASPLRAIPLRAIPLRAIPLRAIDVNSTPLRAIDVDSTPLRAIEVEGLSVDGTPLRAIPLRAIPLRAIDLEASPLRAIPLRAIPLRAIPLRAIDLEASPLRAIPLRAIDIQGSPLASIPLRAIDPQGTDLQSAPLRAIPLRAIPLRAIPLRAIPLRAIDVDGTPLRAIPLRAIDVLGSPLRAIPLRAITTVGAVNCFLVDCTKATLGDAFAAGAVPATTTLGDIVEAAAGIRLGDIASSFNDITAAELAAAIGASDHTLAELLTFDDLVLGDLPTDRGEFGALTLSALGAALADASIGDLIDRAINQTTGNPFTEAELQSEVDAWTATVGQLTDPGVLTVGDLLESANGQVFLDDLGSLLDFITVEQLVSIVGQPLLDQIAAMTTTLEQLTGQQLGQLTLLDLVGLAQFGNIEIGELLSSLSPVLDDYTLGDLLLALVDPGSLAAGGVEFDRFDERSLPVGTIGAIPLSATFDLTTATGETVTVEIELPSSAAYVPGTALVGGAPQEPVQVGQTLVWTSIVPAGATQVEIRFEVLPALRLGSTSFNATASVVGTDVSSAAATAITVAEGSEPNDFQLSAGPGSPRHTTAATEDVVYLTYVATATDIDVFEIDLAENDRLVVQLSNLDADLDVVLWGRPDDASVAGALGPISDEAPLLPVLDPDAGGADATPIEDFVRLDALDPTLGLVAASNLSGNADEVISTDRLPAGTYFVQVYGANGATNVAPASLQLKVRESAAPPVCRATGPLPAASTPSAPTIPASANTLILVNQSRIEQFHGASDRAAVTAATGRLLTYLAANPQLGISPVVVPVDAYPAVRSAYDAWDSATGSCDPEAANDVVAAINAEIIEPRRAQFDHIVFLGGDELIPMARVHDGTQVANEYDYRDEFDGDLVGGPSSARNAVSAHLWESMILTDEPYGENAARSTGDGYLYVSDAALGRVVETPAEIVDALDTFVEFDGSLSIDTATALGYDFLSDGSSAVADELDAAGLPVDRGLEAGLNAANELWSAADATAELVQAGTNALISLNAHFDHYRALPAVGDKVPGFDDNLIAAEVEQALGPDALAQSIVFSMGCHSGLSVSDVLVGSTNADWAQTLGRQDALFVGNTGFGYGDTETVAYTEELMRLFAERVTSPFALPLGPNTSSSTVGQALTWAKNDFVAGLQTFSVYDEKAVMESTFFGLPFYRVGLAPEALPPAPTRTAGPDGTGTSTSRVEATASNTTITTPSGSYPANFDADGNELVVVAPGRPIQPRLVEDISVVDPADSSELALVAHGAIVEDMSSVYVSVTNPVIATPVFDASAGRPEPEIGEVAFPTKPLEITTATGPGGQRQQLVLATGQYRSDNSVQRLDGTLDVVVYYADPNETDFTPPTIGAVASEIVGGRLAISTTVDDGVSGVDRVYVLVVQNPGFGPAEWTGVDLVRSGSTDRWTGSLLLTPGTTDVEFIVQAKDGAGNVGFATNKARNFDIEQPPAAPLPPTQVLTAAPATAPGGAGTYGGAVEIVVTANAAATYVVDGAAPQPVPPNGRFTIEGEGLHTWQVSVPSGYTVNGTVLIDTSAPVVAADRTTGTALLGTPVTLTAGDAGAGVASITYRATGATTIASTTVAGASATVVLAAEGETVVTVFATDTVGNVSASRSFTYTVDGGAPVVTGTLSAPPNAAGWHRQPFEVIWSTDDPAATVPPATPVTLEGLARVITSAPSCDTAGNCAVGTVTVNVDFTAPNATIATDESANAENWNNTPVTVRVTCEPDLSGVTCPAPVVVSTDGRDQSVAVSVQDLAGNVTSLVSRLINIDRVAPTVTWTAPATGAVVPQSTYVRPTCQVSDALSGTDGVCTVDIPEPDMTTPGRAVYTATAVGSDKAGNTTTLTSTYTVLTDEAGPLVDVTAAPPSNPAGWWRTPVTHTFVCSDPTGVASCPGPVTLSTQGANQSFTVTATDNNANGTTITVSAINIDLTPPTLTVTAPTTVGPADVVTITCAATDALSGIATSACIDQTIDASTLAVGPNTFTFTATDVAGNVATTTRTVTVVVANSAPVVRADMGIDGLNEIGFQSNVVVINGTFADPSGPGPFTASVRWTATGAFTPLILSNNNQFVAAFVYGSTGTRTVTVRICDAGGSCGTDDLIVRTRVTQKITPVRQCIVDRGASVSPRYQARWGYNNPAPFAIAVPSIPILENTFTSAPFLRGQPQILLPGNRSNVFTTTFNSGSSTWRINGNSATANSTSTRCVG